MLKATGGSKSTLYQELRMTLSSIIKKVKKLEPVPIGAKNLTLKSTKSKKRSRRMTDDFVNPLLPYGAKEINNKIPARAEPICYKLVVRPIHGMFRKDDNDIMCYMSISDILKAPVTHLLKLREEYMHL